MREPRGCDSCGRECERGDYRVKCKACAGFVHRACRDITDTCYACRYRQARAGGIAGDMLAPQHAEERPFETNQPTTAAKGVQLPPLAGVYVRYGASANALRIMTTALYLGWHLEAWEGGGADYFTLRQHRRGFLRVSLNGTGRVISASTPRKYLTPNTTRILRYLEKP
ncbi:hypothetical protein ACH4S8_37185 [Streptomyces sp. NPDC021080]|uniref:hypothetical protein n=1 Tax=Streptomyces sp. NPDC021080 TaxID=3365110 RepID=UPI0037903164